MKKHILIIIILLYHQLFAAAQWYGDGKSPANAFYGKINSSYPMSNWNLTNFPNGVVYVGRNATGQYDLEIENGGSLNISGGITVKFCTTQSDLIISGTGYLNAAGSSGSYVVFTKNTEASWGHISFNGSTGTSSMDFCEISYGLKSGSGVEGYGGGLHINTSNLTVTNSVFHHNQAKWGGGIFVHNYVSPTIKKCHIYSNTATSSGGGIYIWYGSSVLIENCIIDNNTCTNTGSTYGGGGLGVYSAGGAAKVVNCTIADNLHNTTGTKLGDDIHLNSVNAIKFINCVIWSPTDYSVFIDASVVATNFINSAIRNVYNSSGVINIASSYTNSFQLNISNTGSNPSGPYFNATDGSNWSVQFISPCRDAGANSYTGVTIPTQDYAGYYRIGSVDIGAYEVQYSRWKTTPSDIYTWSESGNWEQGLYPGHPNATGDIVIPALESSGIAPTVSSVSISQGKYMIMEPGAKATIGSLTNNGSLLLRSNADSIFSLIVDSYSGNNANFEFFLSGGGSPNYKWHYISSPVTSLSTDPFTAVTANLAQYVESRPTTNLLEGWVAYNGYIYSTGSTGGPTFNSFTVGQGYNFYDNIANTISFSGIPNTGDKAIGLSYSGNPSLSGFNLLGNPFTSGLNWDDVVNGVYYPYPSSTSKGLYFTRDNQQCSYIGGVGTPEDVTGIIPPMQGFFIKTYSTGNSITIPDESRTHDNIHQRYKGISSIPLVRIKLLENDVKKDETVIRFDEKAKQNFDYDFDAIKMFISSSEPYIYSSSDGVKYAINGQPIPSQEISSLIIPLTINLVTQEEHIITATQVKNLPLDVKVFFKDNYTSYTADLTESDINYRFTSTVGTISDRFSIVSIMTNSDLLPESRYSFLVYPAYGYINIILQSDKWDGKKGNARVFDLTGKELIRYENIMFSRNSETRLPAPEKPGIYFIEMKTGQFKFTGRFVIK